MPHSIETQRDQIDHIDRKLVELLSERARIAHAIGLKKRTLGKPIFDPEREKEIFEKIHRINLGPLSDSALNSVFHTIIAETRNYEEDASFRNSGELPA